MPSLWVSIIGPGIGMKACEAVETIMVMINVIAIMAKNVFLIIAILLRADIVVSIITDYPLVLRE